MHTKKIIKISIIAVIVAALLNIGLLALAKKRYRLMVIAQFQKIMQQQYYLLQRLGKNLLPIIKQGNQEAIRVNLRAAEDLLFGLAKHNLAIPMSLNYVSFSMPQQIIGSNGNSSSNNLAPDDAYYLQVTETAGKLVFSKPYVKVEMPEYWLCNWGIGLLQNEVYYGQLDAKVALEAVQDYLEQNLTPQSKIFNFQLTHSDIRHIKFTVNVPCYIKTILGYLAYELILLMALILSISYALRARQNYLQNKTALANLNKHYHALQLQSNLELAALAVQYRYGATNYGEKTIDVSQLLSDIQAVNAPLAMTRQVQLILPESNNTVLQFQGDALRLMQILASLLHEIILQLVANSNVNLQLLVTDVQQGMQLLQFKFSDDGFYNSLQDRQQPVSNADIASQGWSKIYELIELEEGTLEHQHTAYGGNMISFTIVRKVATKVVNIDRYYTKDPVT